MTALVFCRNMYYTYNVDAQCHGRYGSYKVDTLNSWVDPHPSYCDIIAVVGSRRQPTQLLSDVRHYDNLATESRPAQVERC